MLNDVVYKCREAVYILSVLSLGSVDGHYRKYIPILQTMAKYLDLSDDINDKYNPLLLLRQPEEDIRHMSKVYVKIIGANIVIMDLVFEVMHLLTSNHIYNASSRVFLKSLARLLEISYADFIYLERNLSLFIERKIVNAEDEDTFESNNHGHHSFLNYTKIGLTSLGVGVVAAIAGGIAAPAIALHAVSAAMAISSTNASLLSAATSLSSSSVTGSLFGALGTGITSYKLINESRPNQEFEIECHNVGHMTVTIFISGWLNDKYDYQRSFGVVPSEMPLKERLQWFYTQHDPSMLNKIDELCDQENSDEELIFSQVIRDTGFDPRKEEHLMPNSEEFIVSMQYWKTYLELQKTKRVCRFESKNQTLLQFVEDNLESEGVDTDIVDLDANPLCEDYDFINHDDTILPESQFWSWRELGLSASSELRLLRWDSAVQLRLGDTVPRLYRTVAGSLLRQALNQMRPVFELEQSFRGVMSAATLPLTVLRLTNYIDNVWLVAERRADRAGILLASTLVNTYISDPRPVSLVGFSMGARVIFSCLKQLKLFLNGGDDDCPAGNIIEHAVLMGAPVSADSHEWDDLRDVVSGRLINCYSDSDLILALVYRVEGLRLSVAGVTRIASSRTESFNVGSIIHQHGDYCSKTNEILKFVHIDSY
jgi:hypothetical protein